MQEYGLRKLKQVEHYAKAAWPEHQWAMSFQVSTELASAMNSLE